MTKSQEFDYTYTGTILPEVSTPDGGDPKRYPYLPEPDLVEAVNLSIDLKRPLLLEGDPGCGKTCLAEALVYELTQKNQAEMPFYRWDVKSSTRYEEGLYAYDAVGRLRDAQMLGANLSQLEKFLDPNDLNDLKARLKDKTKYREFGKLGNAIREPEKRAVVLIDEVDKADSDFANNLLLELDRYEFTVRETGEKCSANSKTKPIIILTSNREKPLPAPFLRRCLYFYVQFPRGDRLRKIVEKRLDGIPKDREALVTQAIAHIENDVRPLLQNQPGSRPPGTSEFLDFLTALWKKQPQQAKEDLENLAQRLPLLGILLKTQTDQELYRRKFDKA